MLLLQILYILGVGVVAGGLMCTLIYCLGVIIWGAITWNDKE